MATFATEVAALTKLCAEVIKNANRADAEATAAVAGNRLMRIRLGLLPQVMLFIIAQFFCQFEKDVQSASILGVVGAGCNGLQIAERIKVR